MHTIEILKLILITAQMTIRCRNGSIVTIFMFITIYILIDRRRLSNAAQCAFHASQQV